MFSIRSGILAAALAGVAWASGGCQIEHRLPGPEPLSTTPIVTDQAMELRDWKLTAAKYTNDLVLAYPTYSPLHSEDSGWSSITDTVFFIGNTFYAAYGVFVDPPWKLEGYKSLWMRPTYTAMPPLPPSAVK